MKKKPQPQNRGFSKGFFVAKQKRFAIDKSLILHVAVIVLLFALQFVLPAYHHGNLARIMVLAGFAMGYNMAFGYTGLLSLGHSLFFGAGLYGFGLAIKLFGISSSLALLIGVFTSFLVAGLVGILALRTAGVAFMIVTLMFAQVGYLTALYFSAYTRGEDGFVIERAFRSIGSWDLAISTNRYFAALLLFTLIFAASFIIIRSSLGRVLIAIRENENRSRMLGYDPFFYKLLALCISGMMAGASGAGYGLLFGYVGASFAAVQYSILPLLWVLLGGAGTLLGPLVGTAFMFYLIDIASDYTSAHLIVVGVTLLILVLWAPKGILGVVRQKVWPWLP